VPACCALAHVINGAPTATLRLSRTRIGLSSLLIIAGPVAHSPSIEAPADVWTWLTTSFDAGGVLQLNCEFRERRAPQSRPPNSHFPRTALRLRPTRSGTRSNTPPSPTRAGTPPAKFPSRPVRNGLPPSDRGSIPFDRAVVRPSMRPMLRSTTQSAEDYSNFRHEVGIVSTRPSL
jgi:hypothetical protein